MEFCDQCNDTICSYISGSNWPSECEIKDCQKKYNCLLTAIKNRGPDEFLELVYSTLQENEKWRMMKKKDEREDMVGVAPDVESFYSCCFTPSHWMPLPDEPEDDE